MKIVSWNCHWGFDMKKYQEIMKYNPELLIVQECEKTDFDYIKNLWDYKNWYCDDFYTSESEYGSNNGIAIFSNHKIEFTELFNRKYRYVVPYEVTYNDHKFYLFSVWVKSIGRDDYATPLYDAIDFYRKNEMFKKDTIIIGDFNTGYNKNNDVNIKRYTDLKTKLTEFANGVSKNPEDLKMTYFHTNKKKYLNDFCFINNKIKCKPILIPEE